MKLRGDDGARRRFARFAAAVVAVPQAAAEFDLDTREDGARLERSEIRIAGGRPEEGMLTVGIEPTTPAV